MIRRVRLGNIFFITLLLLAPTVPVAAQSSNATATSRAVAGSTQTNNVSQSAAPYPGSPGFPGFPGSPGSPGQFNPLRLVEQANRILPNYIDADETDIPGGSMSASMSILVLLTILSIAPALLILCTSFTRIVVVLSLLRQAIGTQSLPPSQVIIGLAMFMTFLIMAPTFEQMNRTAIVPLHNGEINEFQAWHRAKVPLRKFMFAQIDYANNWADVYMILDYRGVKKEPEQLEYADVDMITLIPAFILSELKTAFLIGFKLYLPFLIIDMVIASVLISMGMLMLPPVLISLPFKLLLFVLVDGWHLVTGNLLSSFAVPGVTV